MFGEFGEFFSFHEINGGWELDEVGEDIVEEIMLDNFVEGVRVRLVAVTGESDAM